jgi:hypothetical protein
MFEDAPLGQFRLTGLVRDGCGITLSDDQSFEAI